VAVPIPCLTALCEEQQERCPLPGLEEMGWHSVAALAQWGCHVQSSGLVITCEEQGGVMVAF
jgi:hypothetical protein